MPEWELAIWARQVVTFKARDTLILLDVQTYPDWVGEMPPPKDPPKDEHERQVRRAHEEGTRQRRAYRERLQQLAYGEALVAGNDELTLNQWGDAVDSRGVIHARNARHIKEILGRKHRR